MSAQLEALRRYVTEHPTAPAATPEGRAVVVGSGKGGVGTSLVAALLGVGAAASGARVLLIDGDPTLGSLHLLFGVPAGPGLEALRRGDAAEDLVTDVAEGIGLLTVAEAGSTLAPAERLSLFRRLSGLQSTYDLVVVDGGSRLDSVLGACAAGAARVLITSTTDRIALTSTYALSKVLAERAPALPVDLMFNRTDARAAASAADEVGGAVRHFLRRTVGYAGWIPEDESLRAAIEAGMDLQDAAVGSPAGSCLKEIASSLIGQLTAGPQNSQRHHLSRRS